MHPFIAQLTKGKLMAHVFVKIKLNVAEVHTTYTHTHRHGCKLHYSKWLEIFLYVKEVFSVFYTVLDVLYT